MIPDTIGQHIDGMPHGALYEAVSEAIRVQPPHELATILKAVAALAIAGQIRVPEDGDALSLISGYVGRWP